MVASAKTNPAPARRQAARQTAAILAAVALALIAGCQVNSSDHRVVRARSASFNWTLERIDESVRSRPEKLTRTTRHIEDVVALDARRTADNPAEVARWLDADVERWRRNQHIWLQRIDEYLAGKPDRIPENALILWY